MRKDGGLHDHLGPLSPFIRLSRTRINHLVNVKKKENEEEEKREKETPLSSQTSGFVINERNHVRQQQTHKARSRAQTFLQTFMARN